MDQNVNPEKEAQAAVQEVLPQQKKSGRMALQIFAVLVLIGLVGYGVYAWQNNRVAQLNKEVADLKKTTVVVAKKTTADPYAGWKTYTAQYEKFNFKYPSSFTVGAVSTPAGKNEGLASDRITIAGTNGFNMVIQTGMWGVGGGCEKCTTEYTEPITMAGTAYHLNYINMNESKGMVTTTVVATDPDAYMGFLKGKTIKNDDGSPALMSFSFNYQVNGTDGATKSKSLTSLKADENVRQAKLLLESLSY